NGVWGSNPDDIQAYNDSMDLVRSNFEYLADSTELFFAPVGEAFRTKWNDSQADLLWVDTGDLHPNPRGSYITACVFYATIFQKNSQGTDVTGSLAPIEINDLQILADTTVLNNLPDWRINTYNLYSNFNVTVTNNQASFNNLSQNVDSVEWDFGDGSTSSEIHPNHIYNQTGDFDVKLTTYKGDCNEVVTKTISIAILDINNFELDGKWNLYPNPFSNAIKIEGIENIEKIEIYTITGQKLLLNDQLMTKNRDQSITIDLSGLASGIYILKVNDIMQKIIKE
ncbi:MAG: T9SS type A sorting domain-containing protein, partial [Bacteroidota bacterium]